MKKLFLSFLVAIVAMSANAQLKVRMFFACFFCMFFESVFAQTSELNYRPFAKDNKVWKTQVGGIMENVYVNIIDGDTVINGKDWKRFITIPFPLISIIRIMQPSVMWDRRYTLSPRVAPGLDYSMISV